MFAVSVSVMITIVIIEFSNNATLFWLPKKRVLFSASRINGWILNMKNIVSEDKSVRLTEKYGSSYGYLSATTHNSSLPCDPHMLNEALGK